MSTEFVNKMLEDGRIDELKLSMLGIFRGLVSEVNIVKKKASESKKERVYMEFIDMKGNFIKRLLLTDFTCREDSSVESQSNRRIQEMVDDFVIEYNYISFLRFNYLTYAEKFEEFQKSEKVGFLESLLN